MTVLSERIAKQAYAAGYYATVEHMRSGADLSKTQPACPYKQTRSATSRFDLWWQGFFDARAGREPWGIEMAARFHEQAG